MQAELSTLVLVPLIAVLAPFLARGANRVVAIPIIVFEIVLGIILGPSLLGWAQPDDYLSLFADFGLAMLFFMAGSEIDFPAIRGRAIGSAAIGWLISLAAGVGVALLLAPNADAAVFIGVALTSTALGTLLPIIRDAGELRSQFGTAVIALGAIGEFGPLLAISLFLSGRSPGIAALVLIGFSIITALAIWLAANGAGRRLHRVIESTLHTSAQFAIRLVILILIALVVLSLALGIDMLLGAFAAGVIFRLLLSGASEQSREAVETKLDGVAFGLLVPVFFINTGLTFDLNALVSDPLTLVLVPIFVVLLLVVRGLPAMLSAPPGSSTRDRVAIGLFGATGLPIIVAVTALGVDQGALQTGLASALVGAGMVTVLVFPLVGLAIRGRSGASSGTDDPSVPIEA